MTDRNMEATTSVLIGAIFTAVMLLQGLAVAAAESEMKFVNGKYDGALSVAKAREWIAKFALANRKATDEFACAAADDCPWYIVLENIGTIPQFEDVGHLLSCYGDAVKGFRCKPCTAFYVGNDLLATAGHCVVMVGNVEPTKRLLVFLPQFDGKNEAKTFEELAKLVASGRIVTEWWIPEGYYNNIDGQCGSSTSAFDVAFLRVDKPKAHQDSFYTLAEPGNLAADQTPVMIIGYPTDQAVFRRPVKVEAVLFEATDPEVQKRLKPNIIKKRTLELYQASKILVMVPSNKGSMYGGGSGGPVFEATEESQTLGQRNVVGVTGFTKRAQKTVAGISRRHKMKQLQEASFTPTITKAMVDAMLLLRDGKPVTTVPAKPIPAGEPQACLKTK